MHSELTLVLRAAAFAAHKHRDQRRKDVKATPYSNPPLALAQAQKCAGSSARESEVGQEV